MKTDCTTCWGYGLWATGDTVPMGPMDAGDGMPSKACPECGMYGVNLVEGEVEAWQSVGNTEACVKKLRDALLWVTLFDKGIAEAGEASIFLDSIPDELLPTSEDIERACAESNGPA